ncbi:SLC13 family permease [Inhella gelatinilytica]|uniref:Anion transporter n=1 Tax=Inhella gelatinilytica TaxID=2795030 RepID=A0A931IS58_9BURK|nr:SLC13 family permease [Inhella gelatinilytica]MBH9551680.1 anion transporter [Inhella gelatinilytica]
MSPTDWSLTAVFAVVYLGMFLGGLPRLKIDRTGIALLGAIAALALTGEPLAQVAQAVDWPTLALLFAFMVVSAQMSLGGFYGAVTRRVAAHALGPRALLAALIAVIAALSAVFSNDVVCLALTPLVLRVAQQRLQEPLPWLVALACAANIGSAATLIGNPQNMLIGAVLNLDFGAYLQRAALPVVLSLGLLWAWLALRLREAPSEAKPLPMAPEPAFDAWQSTKGLAVAAALLVAFLWTDWPREAVALVGAGVLLVSRRLHSREVMGFVDWPLLVLFIGLFIVNHAFARTGLPEQAVAALRGWGLSLHDGPTLVGVSVALSNVVSNVPAVMLLLPHLGEAREAAGSLLALVSTLAGNLLLVGSIANLIVADGAERQGVALTPWAHLKLAAPVALASLALAVALG